jgi:Protein of unknown function (DUF3024)
MVTRNARVSDLAIAKVRRFCDQRVPAEARDQVRLEVMTRAASMTIVERRPLWEGRPGAWTRLPIAQLRRDTAAGTWTLFWADRNRRWHRYDQLDPPNLTTSSRRSTRIPSPCSGDSTAPSQAEQSSSSPR